MITRPRLLTAILALACSCTRPAPPPQSATAVAPEKTDIQRQNDETMAKLMKSIEGREQLPASQVFENVQYLANTRARTFLEIMNGGYAKALGVTCSHCHVIGDFASDEKRPKRAAREMQVMHRMINQELAKMKDIATPATSNRAINCALCHRGAAIPR